MQVQEGMAKVRTRKPQHGSRLLEQGVVNGNSPEGAFLKAVELRLREGLGHEAGFAEQMLIRRASRLLLALEQLDRKPHPLSDHDLRTAAAWENRARLLLITLSGRRNGGLERKVAALAESKPAPEKPVVVESESRSPSLADAVLAGRAPPP